MRRVGVRAASGRFATRLFAGVFLLGCAVLCYVYFTTTAPKRTLNAELQSVLDGQNQTELLRISADSKTAAFLFHLPKGSSVSDTTDGQGNYARNGLGLSYLITTVNGTKLYVCMEEDAKSGWHRLFPKWTLFKVSVSPLPPLSTLFKTLDSP